MPKFTTRVELYGSPTSTDYERLHNAMSLQKFFRNISCTDGNTYELPHAEYHSSGNLTGNDVKNLAITAAKTVWKDFAVLVTTTNDILNIYNLKPAKNSTLASRR